MGWIRAPPAGGGQSNGVHLNNIWADGKRFVVVVKSSLDAAFFPQGAG
jgi:hypothetical protein